MIGDPCFAGRVEEIQLLFRALGKAEQRQPRVIFFEGAPGIGKSALLREFAARAARRETGSFTFHVRPPETGDFRPIAQAALAATNKQLYDKVGGRRKAFETARELVSDWLGAIPGVGQLIAAVLATVRALRRRRRRSESAPISAVHDDIEALLRVASRGPLVLIFDDLHLASQAEIELLENLIGMATSGTRLLLIGAYRPAPPNAAGPPIRNLIAALPDDKAQCRQIKDLSGQEVGLWINRRFPHVAIPDRFLGWLFQQTGGHPAAVESALSRLLDRSVIRFIDRHWEVGDEFGEQHGVVDAPVSRSIALDLSAVSPVTLEVLTAASMLGDQFDGATLALLLEEDELFVEDQLALAAHGAIVEVVGENALPGGEITTVFRFCSSHLRSVLVRDLSPDDRLRFTERKAALPNGT